MDKKKQDYNLDEDEEVISEGSEYSPKSEFSKPRVVQECVQRCLMERSKEMKAGYFNFKIDQSGIPQKTWVPDSREVYNSCVEALKKLLSPEIKQNENYKKVQKKVEEKIETLFKKYCYEELELKLNEQRRVTYKKTGFKYIPLKGEKLMVVQLSSDGRLIAKELIGGWDRKVDFYLDELVKLNDELFGAMNELIDSMNYFKSGMSF